MWYGFRRGVQHTARHLQDLRCSVGTCSDPLRRRHMAFDSARLARVRMGPIELSVRGFAIHMKPQELHRHRKRLDGFGKDAAVGDSQVLAECRQLLGDHDWYSRKVAIDTLARVSVKGSKEELPVLYKHLEDEDIFVREASVDAVAVVANRGDNEAVAKMAARLVDEDCFVRTRAVVAMGELCEPGDTGALTLLEDMFEDGFVPVRKKTIQVLIKLAPGEPSVRARLEKCLGDVDSGVRQDAKEALSKL
mmetsp:Transcript_63361/g.151191  ORF Transcript_63361/g.151191 Transcript_63361/m.151191 type:complete len:249 (-) Transcript_63361:11-757(-)